MTFRRVMALFRIHHGGHGSPPATWRPRPAPYWAGINNLDLTLAYYYDDVKALAGSNVKNPWQVSFIADYSLSSGPMSI